jgi:membrane protease YdiL (CAAX protease family)
MHGVLKNFWARRSDFAEATLAALLLGYGWFSTDRLVLLLLLASFSPWTRGLGWRTLGLERPSWRAARHAVIVATAVVLALPTVIVPVAQAATGQTVDLASIDPIQGDGRLLLIWLAQAWTLAAFGEEMVFRGYIIRRVAQFVSNGRVGILTGLAVSSVYFGWAHRYQGPAGMLVTGAIGLALGILYVRTRSLTTAIMCHAVIDTIVLLATYFGYRSLIVPY